MWQKIASFLTDNKTLVRYLLLPAVISAALLLGGLALWKYALEPSGAFADEEWDNCFDHKVINLALLGFDRNADRDKQYRLYRPDTIMLFSINLPKASVTLISIPRDSYVRINGTDGYDKINHAYMYGHDRPGVEDPHRSGLETVLKTIEDFLGGIPVHYYVSLDMDGVAEIIEHLGGFYYDVDVEVRSRMGRGSLLLEKGYQHLNGAKFLYYVRDRANGGDLGRTQRQQKILIEAFRQLRRQGRLKALPGIYRALTENVETNLSPRQLASLALFGTRVEPDTIKTYFVSGEMQYAPRGSIDALNYWVIDEEARVNLIKEIFGIQVALLPQMVLPGPRRPEAAPTGTEELLPMSPPMPSTPEQPPDEPIPSDHRQGLLE